MAKKWNLKSRLTSAIRRIFFYSPIRREAIKKANGKCQKCGHVLKKGEIAVDHIFPVVIPKIGFPMIHVYACKGNKRYHYLHHKDYLVEDWTLYILNMFCPLDNLQVLCYKCHKRKTKNERSKNNRKT